jgi:hypothetical protein
VAVTTAATFRDESGDDRLSGSIGAPGATATNVLTADGAGGSSWSPAGGGSQPGAARVLGPFPFTHATAGLAAGVAFYTPTIGDILLDGWIEVDTAFDGTTPKGDIGTFVGNTSGLFGNDTLPIDLTKADNQGGGTGVLLNDNIKQNALALAGAVTNAGVPENYRVTPAKFTAANPLKVVVSQDGTAGGVATGSTVGAAAVYIVIATPSLT